MNDIEDLRSVILSWIKDKNSDIKNYLTPEGIAFVNGYCVAKNTIKLIPIEKYEDLLKKYEDLINKYEKLKLKKSNSNINKFINILNYR